MSCMSSVVVLGIRCGLPERSLFCSVPWFILQIMATLCASQRSGRSHLICISSTTDSCMLSSLGLSDGLTLICSSFLKNLGGTVSLLWCTGSLVVGQGLSCPTARGILVPQPGVGPMSLALEGEFLTTGPLGKSQPCFVLKKHLA